MAEIPDAELAKMIPRIRVVARALPTDKSRLVRLAQGEGLVVGMTGDGVNDSPALKKADVGFAMGSGTEVAKEASDIVILDDNFNSIDKAILYGRTIFNNIRKFIIFQLTINVAAVLINFIAPLFGAPNPLTLVQILWINLGMDTLAALAFGGEAALARYMQEKPKRREEPIVSRPRWASILVDALWVVALSCVFLFSDWAKTIFTTPQAMSTAYFTFFVMAAVFNGFNARTSRASLFEHIGENKNFLLVMLLITAVQVALTYLGGEVFRCYGLSAEQWGVVLVAAVSIVPVDLVRKLAMAGPCPE
jgi:calcium-translocating P-type ATPase